MAIKLINDEEQTVKLEINNGDLGALNEITKKWRFKNKESALRFALGILVLTEEGTLCQEKNDGSMEKLVPTDNLIFKA